METTSWHQLNEKIINCRLCPRLVEWRELVAREKRKMFNDWVYWGKPVPGFGDINARLVVLGLAPGAHGSNRTGRMFTGDASGNFLYAALHRRCFANQPFSVCLGDELELKDVFITSVCRCAPPGNQPSTTEVKNCLPYFFDELKLISRFQGIVALGQLAFVQVLRLFKDHFGLDWGQNIKFSHGNLIFPGNATNPWILGSYHPSRQNTQTGRLTQAMFDEIWLKAKNLLS